MLHKVHKYQRIRYGKKKTVIFRCMFPTCSHYLMPEMARGKETICWKCGKEMILTPARMIAKPTCCTNKKYSTAEPEKDKALDSIFEMLKTDSDIIEINDD